VNPHPAVPSKIQVPDGAELVLQAHASGFQIYVCREAADGTFAWTLKGPEAALYDQGGAVIGKHYAGPSWKHNDGSEVTARAVARVDSPDADAIPWLLLSVTSHVGNGALSRVTSIQRIQTAGGQSPLASGCGAPNREVETRSAYEAEYYFYAAPSET
jgi:hypothetical protein